MTETIEKAADVDRILRRDSQAPIYGRRLNRNPQVYPQCGLHLPVTARAQNHYVNPVTGEVSSTRTNGG